MPPEATVHDYLPSTCPHDCPSVCALAIERIDERTIGKVRGARDQPYTAGTICAKVSRYAERVHHAERLTTPLRRTGAKGVGRAAFTPISWDEALDEVAARFADVSRRHGAEAVWPYFYAGTMGLVQRDGIERLRHALGYSRQKSTICVSLADNGWKAGCGVKRGVDGREIADTDQLVVWGGNPVHTQVNVMHHYATARRERGASLVVVDPYRTATAEKADLHLMLRPGTDGALACAMIHVMLAEGLADRDYLDRYSDFDDQVQAHFATRDPAWAARITGLDAAQIIDFARRYATTPRTFLRAQHGFSRSRNGAVNMHAVSCLPAVSGAWRHRGGGALYGNSSLPAIDYTTIMGLDLLDRDVRSLDQSRIGPVLTGDPADLRGGPPVHAMLIQNTNPVAVAPESDKVHAGFARDDLFVCVHEQFMTETAAMADIVLPATMFVEHDDLYTSSGHTFLQLGRRIIDPPGQCRSNHEVICALAERLGARHRGFAMSALELVDATLRESGHGGLAGFGEANWIDCARDFEDMHFLRGFGTDDGRFHFRPGWSRYRDAPADMPLLPDHYDNIDNADREHPFRMVTAPSRWFLNSSFTECPTARGHEGEPRAKIHPDDLAGLGIADDQQVVLGNRRGQVAIRCQSFDGVQRGVIVVESVWPNRDFAGGRGINTLVSADPGAPDGGAVFHDTAVWIRCAA